MRTTIPLAGILALAAFAPAQQGPRPPENDAPARLESLEAEATAVLNEWRADRQRRVEAARKAAAAAAAAGESIPAMRMDSRPDFSQLFPKFEAAAADYAGTDDAVPFLTWLIRNGGGRHSKVSQSAIATLTAAHAGSSAIGALVTQFEYLPRMVGPERAESFAAAVREKNEDPSILGWLALAELGPVIDSADRDSDAYAAARKGLLGHAERADNEDLARKIQAKIDLREKFGAGAVADDIEGIDLDGEAFKLSDYEGKIIFLDFWGDW